MGLGKEKHVNLEIRSQAVIWLVNLPDSNRRQWRWTTLLGNIPDTTAESRVKAAIHWDCKNTKIILTFMWLQRLDEISTLKMLPGGLWVLKKEAGNLLLKHSLTTKKKTNWSSWRPGTANQLRTISKYVNKRAKRSQYKRNEDVNLYFHSSRLSIYTKNEIIYTRNESFLQFFSRVKTTSINWPAFNL